MAGHRIPVCASQGRRGSPAPPQSGTLRHTQACRTARTGSWDGPLPPPSQRPSWAQAFTQGRAGGQGGGPSGKPRGQAEAPPAGADSAPPGPGTLHGTGGQTRAGEDGVSADKPLPPRCPPRAGRASWAGRRCPPAPPKPAPGPLCPDTNTHRLWPQGWSELCARPRRVCPEIPACPPPQAESRGLGSESQCGLPFSSHQTHGSLGPTVHCLLSSHPGSGSCPLASSCWQATCLPASGSR